MTDFIFDFLAFGSASLAWWHWALIALIVPVLGMVVAALVYFKVCKPVLDAGSKLSPNVWSVLATVAAFVTIPAALLCWLYDIIFNVTWATVVFRELPFKEMSCRRIGDHLVCKSAITFSDRLQYHVSHGTGWRKRLAVRLGRIVNRLCEPEHIRGPP